MKGLMSQLQVNLQVQEAEQCHVCLGTLLIQVV